MSSQVMRHQAGFTGRSSMSGIGLSALSDEGAWARCIAPMTSGWASPLR